MEQRACSSSDEVTRVMLDQSGWRKRVGVGRVEESREGQGCSRHWP